MSAPTISSESQTLGPAYRTQASGAGARGAALPLFGQLISASDVEDALLELLRLWMPDYIYELERQHGIPVATLPAPRSYIATTDVNRMPEEQIPSVMVANLGTSGVPEGRGDGRYDAQWRFDIGVQCVVRGNREALRLARLYAAAARAVALQQGQKTWDRVIWVGERYGVLESVADRTTCVGVTTVDVLVPDVVNRHAGPIEPLGPYPDPDNPDGTSPTWPLAQSVVVDLIKALTEEELD